MPLAKPHPTANSRTRVQPPPTSGTSCIVMPKARGSEISITVKPLPGEGIMETLNRLALALQEFEADIVHLMVFGNINAHSAVTEALMRILGNIDWPVTWVEGAACDDSPLAGLQAFAFSGGQVRRIRLGRRVVSSVFEDGAFRHCLLGGLLPEENSSSGADQTKQTLDRLEKALVQSGFLFSDLIRTWFYLDGMLDWYDDFNQVRTQAYSGIEFRTGSLPASTGIGGRNPAATALVAGAWAVRPLNGAARVQEVPSPLQCPAPAYGSSFSRAMEISSPAGCRLFVSGTASIAPDGRTLWQRDARKQIAQTMHVVEAILQSRGLSWSELTRATAYFKHRADARFFGEWCAARGGFSPAVVLANCDVCRDDLLFELELDAWSPKPAV